MIDDVSIFQVKEKCTFKENQRWYRNESRVTDKTINTGGARTTNI